MFSYLHGFISLIFTAVTSITLFCPLMLFGFLKIALPLPAVRRQSIRVLNGITVLWMTLNNLYVRTTMKTRWTISGIDDLHRDRWYLVIANHVSMIDTIAMQILFARKIPVPRFFAKHSLMFVPVLGLAWWALDFTFVKRYTPEYLEKHPDRRGKDIEATEKACRKFRFVPVSVMNFVEGTRFTENKREAQDSPYSHLLKPKAGGIGLVMSVLGDRIDQILDVTLVYPDHNGNFWDFLCGRIREIRVIIRKVPVSEDLAGDYPRDPAFRERFREWLNRLWREKDALIERELERYRANG